MIEDKRRTNPGRDRGGSVDSENGGAVREAGGGKSGYPQNPGANDVEAPVGDEDRDGGASVERAQEANDQEVRQKSQQQRRGAASSDFESNVHGASVGTYPRDHEYVGGGRRGYDIPAPIGDDTTGGQDGKLEVARAPKDDPAMHRGPRPSPGKRDSEGEGKDRQSNEGGPPPRDGRTSTPASR